MAHRPNSAHHIAADPAVWPDSVYAWLCTSATVEGLARGRGLLGRQARLGNRPTPVNGRPQRIRIRHPRIASPSLTVSEPVNFR